MKTLLLIIALIFSTTQAYSLDITDTQQEVIQQVSALDNLGNSLVWMKNTKIDNLDSEDGVVFLSGYKVNKHGKLIINLIVSEDISVTRNTVLGFKVGDDTTNLSRAKEGAIKAMKQFLTKTSINSTYNSKFFTPQNVILLVGLFVESDTGLVPSAYTVPVFNPYGDTSNLKLNKIR